MAKEGISGCAEGVQLTEREELAVLRAVTGARALRTYRWAVEVIRRGMCVDPRDCGSMSEYRLMRRARGKLLGLGPEDRDAVLRAALRMREGVKSDAEGPESGT